MNLSNAGRSQLSKIPGLNKAIDFICARANNVFSVEHNNETGVHTAITADSLTLVSSAIVPRRSIAALTVSEFLVAGNPGNSVTVSVDTVGALTLQRIVDSATIHETSVQIPSTANGTGAAYGNVLSVGRNTTGNGAPGALRLIAKSGAEWYFWVTTAGVLRVGNTVPNEGGSVLETAGSAVGVNWTFIGGADGTDATAAATNVATVTVPALTVRDRLLVIWELEAVTSNITGPIMLYDNTTPGVLSNLAAAAVGVTAGTLRFGTMWLTASRVNSLKVQAMGTNVLNSGVMEDFSSALATMATNWTAGGWTLALRHSGVVAGGTCHFSWQVVKVAGQ